MKSKSLSLTFLVGGLLIVAVLLVYPVLKGEAQKVPTEMRKQDNALSELRENTLASRFYDKLSSTDSDLVLLKFSPPYPVDHQKVVRMAFKKGNEHVSVVVFEYNSADGAKEHYNFATNAVRIPYKLGDQGRKIFSPDFGGISFMKDRFFIAISSKDEKTAERLARYALEAISQ